MHLPQINASLKSLLAALTLTFFANTTSFSGPQPQRDDPGNAWIIYDDSLAAQYWEQRDLWFRVDFASEIELELYGANVMVMNLNNSQRPLTVRVYSVDQGNNNLRDLLWSGETDNLPTERWIWFEIDEEDRPTFAAREKFAIMYGPAPGGDPWNGGGWHGLGDRPPYQRHSYMAAGNAPPTRFGDWTALNSDIMIRANGQYQQDFTDLAVTSVTNHPEAENRRWTVWAGEEINFYATIANLGTADGQFGVDFKLTNLLGETVIEETVEVEGLAEAETLVVECPVVWEVGRPFGQYQLQVTVNAWDADDQDERNNQSGLDQIAVQEANPADTWLGYTDGSNGGLWAFPNNDNAGYGAMFYHPGGDTPQWLTDARLMLFPLPNAELQAECRVYTYNIAENSMELASSGVGRPAAEQLGWLEFNIEAEDYVRFDADHAVLVAWMQSPNMRIRRALTPPQAASNNAMPVAMWQTEDDGESWERISDLDAAIQIQLGGPRRPTRFSLISPEDGDTLAETLLMFEWENSIDPDPGEEVAYDLWLEMGGDSVRYAADDNRIAIDLAESNLQFGDGSQFSWWVEAISAGDTVESNERFSFVYQTLSAESEGLDLPIEFTISRINPNPFNSTTRIDYSLPVASNVSLRLFDLSGRISATLVNEIKGAGTYSTQLNGSELQSGVYIMQLEGVGGSINRKVTLIK